MKAKFNRSVLTKAEHAEIDSFWRPYPKFKRLFHAFYTDTTGKFCVNYIPDSLWYGCIDPFYNPALKANELDDKSLYERLFPSTIVRHPERILTKVNGFWVGVDNVLLPPPDAIDLLLNEPEFFIKVSVASFGGHGVIYYNTSSGNRKDLECLLEKLGDNIIIQKGIRQSSLLASLNKSSVNTLRIVSFLKKDGTVKVYSAILRMVINGAKVDNASSGGITVGIDDNGYLRENAFSASGVKYPHEHPDSKVAFSSIKIPNYSEIRDLIKKLHAYLPQFRLLSWDLAIDEDNRPVLVEVNMASGELDFHQLNNGPIFGEDTKEILDEVFGKNRIY